MVYTQLFQRCKGIINTVFKVETSVEIKGFFSILDRHKCLSSEQTQKTFV